MPLQEPGKLQPLLVCDKHILFNKTPAIVKRFFFALFMRNALPFIR